LSSVVLLTGSTGFVGSQVLRELGKKGALVRAVVREGQHFRLRNKEGIESIVDTPDLFAHDYKWWASVCRGVDTVIHVAWYVEPGQYLQSPKNLDCLIGTLNLVKGLTQAGVKRFIGIGTCFEYELTSTALSTSTILKPLTAYAGAKVAAFNALSNFLPQKGVEFAWCRLFYLYGEGEDARRLVPYLRSMLTAGQPAELTSGKQVRDFLNVQDAGQMIVEVALGKKQGPINICSGIPITVRQLAEKIADEYGRRDLLNFGSRPDNLIDPEYVVGVRSMLS